MSIKNLLQSANLTNKIFDVYCNGLYANNLNVSTSGSINLSGGNIYAHNFIASNSVHAASSVSSSGSLVVDTITAAGNITTPSSILGDIVSSNFLNAGDTITSSGSIIGLDITSTGTLNSDGPIMTGNYVFQKSNVTHFPSNATISATELINGILVDNNVAGSELTLPNASGIFAALGSNVYVGMQFTFTISGVGPSTFLADSADGSCIEYYGPGTIGIVNPGGAVESRVCTCVITSLNPADSGAITVY